MKLIQKLALLGSLAFGLNAGAFDFVTCSLNGGTNVVAASSTNSPSGVTFTAAYSSDIALQPSFKLTGAGSSAVVFVFDTSLDGTTWYPAAFNISITANGTTPVSKVATQALGSTPYIKLSSIQNPNASIITNLALVATMKRGL